MAVTVKATGGRQETQDRPRVVDPLGIDDGGAEDEGLRRSDDEVQEFEQISSGGEEDEDGKSQSEEDEDADENLGADSGGDGDQGSKSVDQNVAGDSTSGSRKQSCPQDTNVQGNAFGANLEKLKCLCFVLDMNYTSKLRECDISPGEVDPEPKARSNLQKEINRLQKKKMERFAMVQKVGKELIDIWKSSHVSVSKSINLVVLYAVVDASTCDEVTGAKFLSDTMARNIRAEMKRWEAAKEKKIADKYKRKKEEVQRLMLESHLVPDMNFDPNKYVEPKRILDELKSMQPKISQLKQTVLDRRELVLRIESIEVSLSVPWPLETTKVLVARAQKLVEDMKRLTGKTCILYDGKDAAVVLKNALRVAFSRHLQEKPSGTPIQRSKTRSGKRFRVLSPEDVLHKDKEQGNLSSSSSTEQEVDWTKLDRRRILYVVYCVQDLDSTINCYTKCMGMKLLRRDNCTQACLGLDIEGTRFSIQVTSNQGTKKSYSGEMRMHIVMPVNAVHKVAQKITSSSCCKLVLKPDSQGPGLIAIAEDRDANLFELIGTKPQLQQPIGVVLYVTDVDESMKFYRDVIGMKPLMKKVVLHCNVHLFIYFELDKMGEPPRNGVALGYPEESKETMLELRANGGVTKSTKGNLNLQLFVATDDINKTKDALIMVCGEAHRVQQEPEGSSVSLLDPDGHKIVLVQREDNTRGANQPRVG